MSDLPQQMSLARFGEGFWRDHARQLVKDPSIAIVEIIANSWDAGADTVKITWPDNYGGVVSVVDNGIGMTYDEFMSRWTELNYNRSKTQGREVLFPSDNRPSQRKAFGQNGKGRHSMFCFDFTYTVETWKNGDGHTFQITQTSGQNPFSIQQMSAFEREGHGTAISGSTNLNYIKTDTLRDLIGSKFVSDPSFGIYVNDVLIELVDLSHLSIMEEVEVKPYGTVRISRFDSRKSGRTSQQHGVAWWVNRRSVGPTSWHSIAGDSYIDARTSEAKRFTFIVEADILADEVSFDWTGFNDTPKTSTVITATNHKIQKLLDDLFHESRKDRKKQAIKDSEEQLRNLPKSSRQLIGDFIDDLQSEAPTIGQEQLSATVAVLSKLEEARTGYKLLNQLAQLSVDDIDALSDLLEKWTVRDAQIVLEELYRRLKLIEKLEQVVEIHSDELHVIHPLFVKGLWIFGPEYESISYTSNQSLSTVVANLLGDKSFIPQDGARRPDFVVLSESHLGVFSSDQFDESGEVMGIRKVLIVELKKGSFEITSKELRQAEDYATEIRKSGKIGSTTEIVCYVLGTRLHPDASETRTVGNQIVIHPKTYSTILRQAHARTFYLQQKIEDAKNLDVSDLEVEEILNQPKQNRMF